MCGICGWISYQKGNGNVISNYGSSLEQRLEVTKVMNRTLLPRGPDEHGIWVSVDEECIFGHTRLIVMDPKGGKQPMTRVDTEGNTYTITYNGELYNTEEVRNELEIRGHSFQGYSDTEVLLRAYMEWNDDCLSKLNGMFAFVIWSDGKIFFARDRIGVKPFFYAAFPNDFIFGSEIKTLLENPMVSRDVPFDALNTIFAFAAFRPSGFVPFKDIHELQPGHAGTFSKADGLNIWKYWQVNGDLTEDSMEVASAKVHNLLKVACNQQTVSDVPFGALLSGGLDSTALMHFAYEKNDVDENKNFVETTSKLQAFSLGLPDYDKYFESSSTRAQSDEDFIRLTCSKYPRLDHHWIPETSEELVQAVEATTIAKDWPIFGDIDPSLFLLFKKIKPFATMVLSGEASDELFGGYKSSYIKTSKKEIPCSTALSYQHFIRENLQEKLQLREREIQIYENWVSDIPASSTRLSPEETLFRRQIYMNMKCSLQYLLERKDRLSMCSGVEVRVPFADHRLIDYAFQLPKAYKMHKGIEKYVLRESMKFEKNFPEEVRSRTKASYPSLVDPGSVRLSRALFATILENPASEPIFQWFDYNKIKMEFKNDFKNSKHDSLIRSDLMTYLNLYSLNFWFKYYRINVV